MEIIFTERFKKRFNKLSTKVQRQFEDRLELFTENSQNPLLKVHPLRGNLVGFRAFSVTGDYRAVFRILDENTIKLVNIGTHNQVY